MFTHTHTITSISNSLYLVALLVLLLLLLLDDSLAPIISISSPYILRVDSVGFFFLVVLFSLSFSQSFWNICSIRSLKTKTVFAVHRADSDPLGAVRFLQIRFENR